MKLIFLDIDGVLNSKARGVSRACTVEAEKLATVAELIAQSGARVILTSSWRLSSEQPWKEAFDRGGVTVWGQTPRLNGNNREREILAFLEGQTEVEGFVILDDQARRWRVLKPHLVRIDPRTGLTQAHADRALAILRSKQ